MQFSEWLSIQEAQMWSYMGPLQIILGTGEAQRLHYGTAQGMSPMLYVPLKDENDKKWSSIIKSVRKHVDKHAIHCIPDKTAFSGFQCNMYGDMLGDSKVSSDSRADIMWTGESHVTVAYGSEIEKAAQGRPIEEFLQNATTKVGPLFYETRGLDMPVYPPIPEDVELKYGPAHTFTTPLGTPPIAVILPVVCPNIKLVREALGLPMRDDRYTTHVTVGYVVPVKGPGGTLTTSGKQKGTPSAKALAIAGRLRTNQIPQDQF